MNFKKSCLTNLKRILTLILSAGFLSVSAGCNLRESTAEETTQLPKQSAAEIIAQFQENTPLAGILPSDQQHDPIEKPELSGIFNEPAIVIHPQALPWIELHRESTSHPLTTAPLLMTPEEIRSLNQRIIDECPAVVDIAALPETLSGQTVRDMIYRYTMPSGEKYTQSGTYIDAAERQKILARREGVTDTVTVRPAVIVNRCDLKGLPTEHGFYSYGDRHYSAIQETELITGFPVWILHESSDGKFYFVQSYYYSGWIPANCAAVCTREEFERFAFLTTSGQSYITVISPRLDVNGVRLDMGAVLPYLHENETEFTVSIPQRSDDGTLTFREERLSKDNCVFGSLPYTWANYLNQAFAYLGTPYGWGGADGGVDCSGFVCAVFRCFGIFLPRNTGEQSKYNGQVTDLSNLTLQQKQEAFSALSLPSSIHWTGHVMLYLGEQNGEHYVIHAPQGGETVTVMKLNLSDSYICAVQIH